MNFKQRFSKKKTEGEKLLQDLRNQQIQINANLLLIKFKYPYMYLFYKVVRSH